MNSVLFLFLRRMRAPLLVLLAAYAISVGGMVLIPGADDQGEPWQMTFFHAFYFVSYMGSTIGFGEIPYEFTDAQRFWVVVTIYLSVISWLYAIGTILSIIQDPAFKRAVTEQRFTLQVRRLRDPFYLIVGYGESGSLLVPALERRQLRSVVIDNRQERIDRLELENFGFDVPGLCADGREVHFLREAGIDHPYCIGVVALTDDPDVNVKVAITAKLLKPDLTVICRAESRSTEANLASFGTDYIINPYRVFADHLTMALRAPSVHALYRWLINTPGRPLPELVHPPRGTWIICGHGRFGRAVGQYLAYENIPTVFIEPRAERAPPDAIIGFGTEAVTLREAGIDQAVALVAGADLDINNLSIVMTAKALKPSLHIVVRQNRRANDVVFAATGVDQVMQAGRIIVWRILPLLTTPLLSQFLRQARHHSESWASALLEQIQEVSPDGVPLVWSVVLDHTEAPAVCDGLRAGYAIRLQNLLQDPRETGKNLPCMPLMLVRGGKRQLLPTGEQMLQQGDQLLLCGVPKTDGLLRWSLFNRNVLRSLMTGERRPDGYIWRWLGHWRSAGAPE